MIGICSLEKTVRCLSSYFDIKSIILNMLYLVYTGYNKIDLLETIING